MPQVAARINNEQEQWLKEYFRTKSAGAEFILPWAVDTFFRAMSGLKQQFTSSELKVIVDAHKDLRLMPDTAKITYLLVRVGDMCDRFALHEKHNVGRDALEAKIKRLDDTQATALMVWASAYWVSRECSAQTLERYVVS